MTTLRHLANAPIQEGLIDLRLGFTIPPDQEKLNLLAAKLQDAYEISKPLHKYEAHFAFGDGMATADAPMPLHVGMRFQSVNSNFVFQAQPDGFTLSMLRPYGGWDKLLAEARRLWTIYAEITIPLEIQRVAVRYINQFEVYQQFLQVGKVLVNPPLVPDGLPNNLQSFLTRIQINAPEQNATILVTQVMEPLSAGKFNFMVDIDVFKQVGYLIHDDDLWEDLNSLRALKNQTFFASLTEEMLGTFA